MWIVWQVDVGLWANVIWAESIEEFHLSVVCLLKCNFIIWSLFIGTKRRLKRRGRVNWHWLNYSYINVLYVRSEYLTLTVCLLDLGIISRGSIGESTYEFNLSKMYAGTPFIWTAFTQVKFYYRNFIYRNRKGHRKRRQSVYYYLRSSYINCSFFHQFS